MQSIALKIQKYQIVVMFYGFLEYEKRKFPSNDGKVQFMVRCKMHIRSTGIIYGPGDINKLCLFRNEIRCRHPIMIQLQFGCNFAWSGRGEKILRHWPHAGHIIPSGISGTWTWRCFSFQSDKLSSRSMPQQRSAAQKKTNEDVAHVHLVTPRTKNMSFD